jgi:four helix bundle protein
MKDSEPPDLRERTRAFALRVIRLSASLGRSKEAVVLGKQVLRSGTSVGANYREAQRARSKAEFIAKVGDSLKELDETLYWLELILGSELIKPIRLQPLMAECNELLAIFTTIHKRAKQN